MSGTQYRSTVYFDPELYAALRMKAAHTQRSISDVVNDAVRSALVEDQKDLAAFEERVAESTNTHEELLAKLRQYRGYLPEGFVFDRNEMP